MNRYAKTAALALALLSLAAPATANYILYSPKPVPDGTKPQEKGAVLAQEVAVKKGDTLFGISRRITGRGSYYPQILLLNDIKNPNLIRGGEVIKVPVKRGGAATPAAPQKMARSSQQPVSELSLSDLNQTRSVKKSKPAAKLKKAHAKKRRQHTANAPSAAGSKPAARALQATPANSGQPLFEQGVKAYRQNNYKQAVEHFDRFLKDHSASPQAADASLYKADSLMKMAE